MFNISICPKSDDCIARFWLTKDSARMGAISVYLSPVSGERGIIEIYIEEQYRKRWLAKSFARQIKDLVITTLKHKNIKEIRTEAIASESPRLLDFFGFDRYNTIYFKLKI